MPFLLNSKQTSQLPQPSSHPHPHSTPLLTDMLGHWGVAVGPLPNLCIFDLGSRLQAPRRQSLGCSCEQNLQNLRIYTAGPGGALQKKDQKGAFKSNRVDGFKASQSKSIKQWNILKYSEGGISPKGKNNLQIKRTCLKPAPTGPLH